MKKFLLVLLIGFILTNCKLSGTETGNPDPTDDTKKSPVESIDNADEKKPDETQEEESSDQVNLFEFPESLCKTLSLCYFESVPLNCIEAIHHSKNLTTTLGYDNKKYPTLSDIFNAIDENQINYNNDELKNCLNQIKKISCDLMDLLLTLNPDHSIDINSISFLTQFTPQCLFVASPEANDFSE